MRGAAPSGKRVFGFRLDLNSGVPVYRQLIDQVTGGMAAGVLGPGDQLPTVRQMAVDLSINPNTVVRAYRELEFRGVLETPRQRQLNQLVSEFVGRAGAGGFTVKELIEQLRDVQDQERKGR